MKSGRQINPLRRRTGAAVVLAGLAMAGLFAGARHSSAAETNANTNAVAADSNATGGSSAVVDFKSFAAIADHNIFDPTRRSRRGSVRTDFVRQTRPSESFTLIGTANRNLAIFSGTSSNYRKNAKPGDMIAGYRISEIAHDHVKLGAAGGKTLTLPLLTQMSRREGGAWSIGPRGESIEAPPPEAPPVTPVSTTETKSAGASPASNEISDVVKRLMQKAAQDK